MADTAYDADRFRQAIADKGRSRSSPITPRAPPSTSWTSTFVPSAIRSNAASQKLKKFRRVATRFEETAQNYLAVITLAAIVLWLR